MFHEHIEFIFKSELNHLMNFRMLIPVIFVKKQCPFLFEIRYFRTPIITFFNTDSKVNSFFYLFLFSSRVVIFNRTYHTGRTTNSDRIGRN